MLLCMMILFHSIICCMFDATDIQYSCCVFDAIDMQYSCSIASSGSNLSKGKWSRSASPSATSQRAPSPALSTVSSRGKQSTASGNSSYSLWVTAVDPKTNRKYWYNRSDVLPPSYFLWIDKLYYVYIYIYRETKVSTWRQPAELLLWWFILFQISIDLTTPLPRYYITPIRCMK